MADFDFAARVLSFLWGPEVARSSPRAAAARAKDARPAPGPDGAARDFDYAAHYAELVDTPATPKLEAGEPTELPELHRFGFENFTPLAPRVTPAPAAAAGPKWRVGKGEDGLAVGAHEETHTPAGTTQTGHALDSGGKLSYGKRHATEVGPDGAVHHGGSQSAGIGPGGAHASASQTTAGKTTSMGAQLNPFSNATAMSVSHGSEARGVGASLAHKDNTTSIGVSGRAGPVGGSVGVNVTEGTSMGQIGFEGLDATLRDFVGDGSYVQREQGIAVSAGADVEYGMFGAGGSANAGNLTKRRHFKAGKGDQPGFAPDTMAKHILGLAPELAFDGVADIDIDALQKGEGYSIEKSQKAGGEGHIKAGVTIGLGKDKAELSQTVLARDASGDIRVMVAQGDESTLSGSIAAGKAASVGAKESTAHLSQVTFTAHGPEGVKAVKEFQQTGMLPGADRVARLVDPAVVEAYSAAHREWEEMLKMAEFVKGYGAVLFKSRLDELREKMCAAAGPVNAAFLEHRGSSLDAAGVKGVRYDTHDVADEKSKDVALSLGGKQIVHAGSKENDSDAEYRDERGEAQMQRAHGNEDSYVMSKTESSQITMNPKRMEKGGDPVAMVLNSKQGATQRERNILAKLGSEAFDMPAETIEAWRDGSMNEALLANIAVTMTEGQLAKIRDKLAIPDGYHTAMLRSGVGTLHESVHNGAKEETASQARLGDADARRDVERYKALNDLYSAAASARARQMLGMKDSKVTNSRLELLGMQQMLEAVDHVKTPEDFIKLTPEEQKLVVVTGAMTMQNLHQSPYECMRLVLQVKDKNQRNDLMRQLYGQIEGQVKGADAAVDFVQWLQASGETQHLSGEEMKQILSGVAVRSEDPDTAQASITHDHYERIAPGTGNVIMGKKLASATGASSEDAVAMMKDMPEQSRQRTEERAADHITDLLQAVRGKTGSAKAVEDAIAVAVKENPDFIAEMWEVLEKDPARAAWANYMLAGTRYQRGITTS